MSSSTVGSGSIVERARTVYGVPPIVSWIILLFPFVGWGILAAMLANPATNHHGTMLLAEDRLVENVTAIGDFLGAILGIVLVVSLIRARASQWTIRIVAVLALMSFGVGGEEISWGQRLLHIKTPEPIADVNEQHEITIHNLPGLQEIQNWFPFSVALIGLVAILTHTRRWRDTRGVPALLLTFCLVTVLDTAYDNFTDWVPINLKWDTIFDQLVQYVQMLAGVGSALGMGLCLARLARQRRAAQAPRSSDVAHV